MHIRSSQSSVSISWPNKQFLLIDFYRSVNSSHFISCTNYKIIHCRWWWSEMLPWECRTVDITDKCNGWNLRSFMVTLLDIGVDHSLNCLRAILEVKLKVHYIVICLLCRFTIFSCLYTYAYLPICPNKIVSNYSLRCTSYLTGWVLTSWRGERLLFYVIYWLPPCWLGKSTKVFYQ